MSRLACFIIVIGLAVSPLAGCASSGATPRPFPTPHAAGPGAVHDSPSVASPGAIASPIGYSVAGTALGLRGVPYRNGGADPSGFDCSGFVQYVLAQHGVYVPRKVVDQFAAGRRIDPDRVEPGDLVFFTTVAPGASHVGIALGGDEFVHAPSTTGEVRVEHLSAAYWSTRFLGARRVL